jgi:hypothetical protein
MPTMCVQLGSYLDFLLWWGAGFPQVACSADVCMGRLACFGRQAAGCYRVSLRWLA